MNIIMRTENFAKVFFLVSFTGLVMYAVLAFYTFHTAFTTGYEPVRRPTPALPKQISHADVSRTDKMYFLILKYILVWTTPTFKDNIVGEGQEPFIKNNCSHVNCYLTTNKDLLKKYDDEFDVVFLDISVIRQSLWKYILPNGRSTKQKYLFHSMRSADETPVCNVKADGYFNWTWSYKIFSDISTPFIEVKSKEGYKVAPRADVKWLDNNNILPLTDKDIENLNLKSKKKAVAWIPSVCRSRSNRFEFVVKLQEVLREHSLELDIYGCNEKKCPNEGCLKMLERDYYFYLAIEPSYTEDYVTEEVLKAYHHNTVPIVKGGADYNRFLPEGSYINGGSESIEKLASLIDFSMKNPLSYYSFFKWKNHYTIQKANHDQGFCGLCAMLNNKELMQSEMNYEKFRKWWYRDLKERCIPKGAEDNNFVISYMNETREPKPDKFPR